jgi:hypothetical protein
MTRLFHANLVVVHHNSNIRLFDLFIIVARCTSLVPPCPMRSIPIYITISASFLSRPESETEFRYFRIRSTRSVWFRSGRWHREEVGPTRATGHNHIVQPLVRYTLCSETSAILTRTLLPYLHPLPLLQLQHPLLLHFPSSQLPPQPSSPDQPQPRPFPSDACSVVYTPPGCSIPRSKV